MSYCHWWTEALMFPAFFPFIWLNWTKIFSFGFDIFLVRDVLIEDILLFRLEFSLLLVSIIYFIITSTFLD
jgi:hypothetical protein